ncbi:hypothetical protein [Pseudobutyrivibrio sp.]|uniref:hypothetical protein n=1 Tax=Pseudobutyrivibrio sp. TaxID=2014367 RepID=UPI0038655690
MYSSKIILLAFIFLATWMGFVNLFKVMYKNDIPWLNSILFAIGVVGVVAYFI